MHTDITTRTLRSYNKSTDVHLQPNRITRFMPNIVLENLAILMQRQPIKINDLDKINLVGRGLLKLAPNICIHTEIKC